MRFSPYFIVEPFCFGAGKYQRNAVFVLCQPFKPFKSLSAIRRITPNTTEPFLRKTVLLLAIMDFCHIPRPDRRRTGVQIKFAQCLQYVWRRQPFFLVLRVGVKSFWHCKHSKKPPRKSAAKKQKRFVLAQT